MDKMPSAGYSVACCSGKSASHATKIIAVLDLILFGFCFCSISILAILYVTNVDALQTLLTPFRADLLKFLKLGGLIKIWIIVSLLLWCLAEVGFACLLYCGTKKRSYGMLRTWIFLVIVDSLFAMMVFIQLIASTTHFVFYIVLAIFYYAYRILALWIVHVLLRELMEHVQWV